MSDNDWSNSKIMPKMLADMRDKLACTPFVYRPFRVACLDRQVRDADEAARADWDYLLKRMHDHLGRKMDEALLGYVAPPMFLPDGTVVARR